MNRFGPSVAQQRALPVDAAGRTARDGSPAASARGSRRWRCRPRTCATAARPYRRATAALARERQLGDARVPLGHRVARPPAVAVERAADVALVGRGVGVAAGEHPVGDREVVGVLRAVPRRTGDDEPAVPVVGQPDHELRVVVPAVRGVEASRCRGSSRRSASRARRRGCAPRPAVAPPTGPGRCTRRRRCRRWSGRAGRRRPGARRPARAGTRTGRRRRVGGGGRRRGAASASPRVSAARRRISGIAAPCVVGPPRTPAIVNRIGVRVPPRTATLLRRRTCVRPTSAGPRPGRGCPQSTWSPRTYGGANRP